MIEERRESRIPRPPPPGRALVDKSNTTVDRKRKAGMDTISEANKRSSRPTRASTPPAAPSFSSTPAPAATATATSSGPATGDESWDDIADRTGAKITDVLGKKLAFKRGTRAEKKVDDMVPMIKELRAVGWHLHGIKERIELDCGQWKSTCEQLEATSEEQKQAWEAKEQDLGAQLTNLQALLSEAEAGKSKLNQELSVADSGVKERSSEVHALQQELKSLTADLEHTNRVLEEKSAKVREMEDVMRHGQSYSSTLQNYNTSLQSDIKEEREKREESAKQRDILQVQFSELSARVKCLEASLQTETAAAQKLRDEREGVTEEVAMLRVDLASTRLERDRLLSECGQAKDDLARYKSLGGNAVENLEALSNEKATLDVQLTTQQRIIGSMRQELADNKEAAAMANDLASNRHAQIVEFKAQVQELQDVLAGAEQKISDSETVRRKLHNIIQELKGNIRVFCRVRPISSVEQSNSDHDSSMSVDFPESTDLLRNDLVLHALQRGDNSGAIVDHTFTFDKVFGPSSSQEHVFEEISELVQSALDGHKVCIFAYGQTGSGKTHTMMGNPEQPGMIPMAMQQIFETSKRLSSQGWVFSMHASMLEIYNEEIKDLLGAKSKSTPKPKGFQAPAPAEGKKHQVLHSAEGCTTVTDLTSVDVTQPERVEALLAEAMEKRSVGCTALNEQSSRSHMVFTLRIEGTNRVTGKKVAGVLNLIDLAGSERVKESGATGVRLKEAQNINKSLSALGDVISALGSKESHIPFRNSKLTYLLQPCLGGDAKTLMFVNVAPSREFAFESLCSLRFAAKVNACEINPKKQAKA